MIPGSANPLLLRTAAAGGYSISRSLRFNSSDSAYLSRTPASAGNRKTWTWAGWVKRSSISVNGTIFSATQNGSNGTLLQIPSGNTIQLINYVGGAVAGRRNTTAVFRDPSAWFHLVAVWDSANATVANRIRIYVNGSEITTFLSSNDPNSADSWINSTQTHTLGVDLNFALEYFNGYLADVHFIDGQALDPTSFGEFSATTGVWMPKAYAGTYGTNGFQLKFADNSSNTATTLGKDTSGNGNNWTPNNLSVTAGAGNDSLVDVPTNGTASSGGDAGGTTTGNYATLNPLDNGGLTLANGNLQFDRATTSFLSTRASFAVSSGKWYWEVAATSMGNVIVGVGKSQATTASYIGSDANGWGYYSADGNKYNNNSNTGYGATWGANDVIGIAFDADAGEIKFYKNGTVQNSGTAAYTGLTSGPYFPMVSAYGTVTAYINFGQRPFAYTAPSGFKALCTANLPAPVVTKPSTVMDVKLYTGNGSSQTISGLEFSPDFVWIKNRSNGSVAHRLYDTVRTATKELYSNLTNAEDTDAQGLNAFTSSGFTVGTTAGVNENSSAIVAWTWDAGSSTVTNTQGSISSQVRANASAGFSICTMTTPSSGGFSFGHELGVAPQLVFFKFRNVSSNWYTYHQAIGQKYILLNGTGAAATNEFTTSPTSTIFTYPASLVVGPNEPIVAYCFAPVAGYSSMGSYVGNGSADGPFVYTGFRPRYVLIKASSTTGDWVVNDSARNSYNVCDLWLYPNLSLGDTTFSSIDIVSNGFKHRNTGSNHNTSGTTYIYAAFAESPFQYARAR